VIASGGAGFYNYSDNAGTTYQSGNTFASLTAASYSIKVKDASGCLSTITGVHIGCNGREDAPADPASIGNYMTLYPNPASDQVTVLFNADKEASYTLRIADMLGRIILTQNGSAIAGNNQIEINLATFAKGVYIIILDSGDNTQKSRLVLQ
jgi:hypothetical protein